MAYAQKTHSMTAGANFLVDLGQNCGRVTVTARAECYVKIVGGLAPTPPGASPAPGAGAAASYVHLAAAGDRLDIGADADGKGYVPGLQDPLRYVVGWGVAAGDLLVVGH